MATDHKTTHSIICEHTRQLAAHDESKPGTKENDQQLLAAPESRLKEFNRSRRVMLADALRLRRMFKGLSDRFK